jgi:hypothetical protein
MIMQSLVISDGASPQPVSGPKPQSYSQILKSSALIGGSSVIKIGLGMIRTKAMAVLLGPLALGSWVYTAQF